MASITNVKICDGYDGLIKTSNNDPITSTPVQLTDGLGNNLPIQVGTNSTIFSQTVDFTNASITGLLATPAGTEYIYNSSATDIYPPSGDFNIVRTQSSTFTTTTHINFNVIEDNNHDITTWLQAWGTSTGTPKAYITVKSTVNPAEFAVFELLDAGTLSTSGPDTKIQFEANFVDGDEVFVPGDLFSITVSVVGDQGSQGVTGPTGPTGPAGSNGDKGDKGDAGIASNGYYASFYDNTDQVISAIDTPQVVQIANTTLSNGVSLIGPKIVIANAGVYDMRVTLQISNPNNSIAQVKAWLRFNGVDYPNSAHYVSLAPRKSSTEPFEVVTTFGFVGESLNANDYVEIYWQSDTSLVSLEAVPGTGHPDSGSVYVNVSNVAEVVTGQKGEPGDKGDTGATGPTGPKGDKGDTGGGGTAGLVASTGSDSMKNADFLVTNPASATGVRSLAIGNEAVSVGQDSISIGTNTITNSPIGGASSIAIGNTACSDNSNTISIGNQAVANANAGIAIGYSTCANAQNSVAIGFNVDACFVNYLTTRKLQLIDTVDMNYENDDTAEVNGVPLGGIYHTNGILKIRIV